MKHIACRAIFALLGLACIGNAMAATYFVNSNGGSDSYNGLAPTATSGAVAPRQHLSARAKVPPAKAGFEYLIRVAEAQRRFLAREQPRSSVDGRKF